MCIVTMVTAPRLVPSICELNLETSSETLGFSSPGWWGEGVCVASPLGPALPEPLTSPLGYSGSQVQLTLDSLLSLSQT